MRNKKPTGIPIHVTDAWKLAVRARLEERGITKAALANKVGFKDAAIAQLLKTRRECAAMPRPQKPVETCRRAIEISQFLDVVLPETADTELTEFLQMGADLRRTNRQLFEAIVGHLRSGKSLNDRLLQLISKMPYPDGGSIQSEGDNATPPPSKRATERGRRRQH